MAQQYTHPQYAGIPPSYLVDLDSIRRPQPETIQRRYVDWAPFWIGGRHTLLQGRTGAGKTTLLLNLLWRLHIHGHRILLRDDGGLDFLYLAPHIPMTIWTPKQCIFKLENQNNYNITIQSFDSTDEILEEAYTSSTRFHAVLYDCYCSDPTPAAEFYSNLFKDLIYRCMQTQRTEKTPLVFSFDELNDLIQPRGMSLTRGHSDIRGMVEYNIRKLRKHRVTLIASTHRFNQIGVNVRSQFSYIMIKQSYGKDVYDFISHNLITAANDSFWTTLKTLTTMGPEYVYVFDYKNSYDKLRVPDIPRPTVEYQLKGHITSETEPTQRYDTIDLIIVAARTQPDPIPYRDIATIVDRGKSTIGERAQKIRNSHPYLAEQLK